MKSLKCELLRIVVMILIVGVVVLSFSGCKKASSENKNKIAAEPTSGNINEVGGKSNGNISMTEEPVVEYEDKVLYDKDSENALKLVTGLLLGIAEGSIMPSAETAVVDVKQGEKSFKIGSYDILKKVELVEVPKINLLDSNNAAWRISFTHYPKITVEVFDDEKVIKLYP